MVTLFLYSLAMELPGSFRLGHWQVPVFGLFVAVGVVGALWLSQRTARLVGLDELKLWDAGVFAVVAAFVASRVLLIAENWGAFTRFPVMVLTLPSLTYGGMGLTVVLVVAYLRWKKVSLRDAMDAWAPCACVLAVFVALGHFFEGTDAGMPTSLPWGVHAPGDTVLGKTHPVQLYAVVVAIGICEWALIGLKRKKRVAARLLVVGGVAAFVLDLFEQPLNTYGGVLDPGQWVALGCVMIGAILFAMPARSTVRASDLQEEMA
jgi:phosphatidylglycerol---prolipoprotein diacylglyceryl transferase